MKTVRNRRCLAGVLLLVACGGGGAAKRAPPAAPGSPASAETVRAFDPFAVESMMADVEWMCADERRGRGSFTSDSGAAADYVADEFRAAGLEVIRQAVPGGAVNVIGIRRGGQRAVIVSAHHDHVGVATDGRVYPGADDNASGIAVLLALARDSASRQLDHTILFISFGAEEQGLIGSGVYVTNPVWPLEHTLAVINFDMVGRNFFEAGAARERAAGVVGLDAHDGARRALERAAAAVDLHLVIVPARLLEVFGYALRTDEWRFRRVGVPAIHFSTGYHADYHEPTDTSDKLIPGQMARIARSAAGLLAHLATQSP